MMGVSTESSSPLAAQSIIRDRLTAKCLPPAIHGYESQRAQLLDLVTRTATVGESNSLLLVGPRGSGKTMLVRSVLEELHQQKDVMQNLMEVHLHGLLQTDDRIALKEITRQLQLENTLGDRVFGSFAETLQFLLEALKSGGKQSKSILFLLEDFDLFAHHKNQTLLYNLFDVSQSAAAPVCVLGLTARLDVMELLEKRVKSRFSHRQLHLLPDVRFPEYLDIFRSYLSLPANFGDKRYVKEWNSRVQELSKDGTLVDMLRRQYTLTKDLRSLLQYMMLPVCRVSEDQPLLEATDFVDSAKHLTTDSKAAMLHGVSVLELCLIIAMKHLTETYDGEPFNFEMVYNEYQRFCQRRSSMQVFEKAVVLKAFEHLCALELVRTAEGATSKTQKEYRLMNLLLDGAQIAEAVQKYPECPTEVKHWAQSACYS